MGVILSEFDEVEVATSVHMPDKGQVSLEKLRADMKGKSLLGFLENELVGRMGMRSRQALINSRSATGLRAGAVVQVQMLASKSSKRRVTFAGTCVAIRRKGIASSFVLRNTILDEGVEMTFPLYSPLITSIRVVRQSRVRRAKLYYMKRDVEKDVVVSESTLA